MKPSLGRVVLFRGELPGFDYSARIIRVNQRTVETATAKMRLDYEALEARQRQFDAIAAQGSAPGTTKYTVRPTAENSYQWEHHFSVWLAVDMWVPAGWNKIHLMPTSPKEPVEFCADGTEAGTWRWPERVT